MVVSADMWWGSSCVPTGVPLTLDARYNSETQRGLEISGALQGPGCGVACGEYFHLMMFMASFNLTVPRMPDRGCRFTSSPVVDFVGRIEGETGYGGSLDDPAVRLDLSLMQVIYSGAYEIGKRINYLPDRIDFEAVDDWETYYVPDRLRIPSLTWELNRTRPVQIDIWVNFYMYVEGTGRIGFVGELVNPFKFDVPQWSIFATDV